MNESEFGTWSFVAASGEVADIVDVRVNASSGVHFVGVPICPDLLDYSRIGAADNLRGRLVRAFFWLLRVWPV